MGLNLYPYNYYILWAAVIALVIMLVLTMVHAVHLLKAVQEKKPVLDNIQKNVQLAKIKTEAMKEKKEEDKKKDRWLKVALPFVLAIYEAYKQDDESHGIKGYKKAAKKVFADRKYQKRMQDVLNVHL